MVCCIISFLFSISSQETTCAEKKVEILYSSRGYFSASQVRPSLNDSLFAVLLPINFSVGR